MHLLVSTNGCISPPGKQGGVGSTPGDEGPRVLIRP